MVEKGKAEPGSLCDSQVEKSPFVWSTVEPTVVSGVDSGRATIGVEGRAKAAACLHNHGCDQGVIRELKNTATPGAATAFLFFFFFPFSF